MNVFHLERNGGFSFSLGFAKLMVESFHLHAGLALSFDETFTFFMIGWIECYYCFTLIRCFFDGESNLAYWIPIIFCLSSCSTMAAYSPYLRSEKAQFFFEIVSLHFVNLNLKFLVNQRPVVYFETHDLFNPFKTI